MQHYLYKNILTPFLNFTFVYQSYNKMVNCVVCLLNKSKIKKWVTKLLKALTVLNIDIINVIIVFVPVNPQFRPHV